MPDHLLLSCSIALALTGASFADAVKGNAARRQEVSVGEYKDSLITHIRERADAPDGSTLRSIYVARLSEFDSSFHDEQLIRFFINLIQNDPNEWVRLEAAADIGRLRIPEGMVDEVSAILEKSRKQEAVNFQALAGASLIRVRKAHRKSTTEAEKDLAKLAHGQDKAKWKIMIPPHNRNTMIQDPESKVKVPFEDFFKTNMRVFAIEGLGRAGSDYSKKVLKDLEKDGDKRIKESAKEAIRNAK
jgi:HEAT repeat protein